MWKECSGSVWHCASTGEDQSWKGERKNVSRTVTQRDCPSCKTRYFGKLVINLQWEMLSA